MLAHAPIAGHSTHLHQAKLRVHGVLLANCRMQSKQRLCDLCTLLMQSMDHMDIQLCFADACTHLRRRVVCFYKVCLQCTCTQALCACAAADGPSVARISTSMSPWLAGPFSSALLKHTLSSPPGPLHIASLTACTALQREHAARTELVHMCTSRNR